MQERNYKTGFVAIIGKPNAGKSTLMNLLVKEELAITHAKAQTTRHKLYGIVSEQNIQIIYTDTPGIIKPGYPLQTAMMEAVKHAHADADIILWLLDAQDRTIPSLFYESKKPILLVLNKIDLLTPSQLKEAHTYWAQHSSEIIPISALKHENIDQLRQKIITWLPNHPPYYDNNTLTDRPERFFAQELIRSKILDQYQQEIPYSTEVTIDSFKEKESLISIRVIIHVERQTQKGIMIGHRGTALKQLGMASREALEHFFQKKIFLEQQIKVTPNWRKNLLFLAKFGYPTLPGTHGKK